MLFYTKIFNTQENPMQVTMDADHTIFAAVDALRPLLQPGQAVLTSLEVRIAPKDAPLKHSSQQVHFLFAFRGRNHMRIWTTNGVVSGESVWTETACHDDLQVLAHDGIGEPLLSAANALNASLLAKKRPSYATASWLFTPPRPVTFSAKKISDDGEDRTYSIHIEKV